MKEGKKSFRRFIFIPLIVGGFFAAVSFVDGWNNMELVVYDLFLHIKPAVQEDENIVLLNVDEEAIVRAGAWPWPRGLMAQGIEVLTEFNAGQLVFDIEYLEKSPMSIDRSYLEGGLNTEFNTVFNELSSNMGALFNALGTGSLPIEAASEYGTDLIDYMTEGKEYLYDKTQLVAVENDSYLGKAMRLFGNAFVTLNMQQIPVDNMDPALRKLAEQQFSYPDISFHPEFTTDSVDFLVPIQEISSMARSAGFTNVKIDDDGIRRRVRLVDQVNGKGYLQLAFSPLMHRLGNPSILVEKHRVVLENAILNGESQKISIPLDPEGHMLIRWPKKSYEDSFNPQISYWALLEYRNNEQALLANLRALKNMESWVLISGANPLEELLYIWDVAEQWRTQALESGLPEDKTSWLETKAVFKEELQYFLSEGWDEYMGSILNEAALNAPEQDRELYVSYAGLFQDIYDNVVSTSSILQESENELRTQLEDAFCIIGWTATATTDMGANPFDEEYINVGTHAAVANTIIQKDFLREWPRWTGSIMSLVLSFLIIFIIRRLGLSLQLSIGVGTSILFFAASYVVFHVTDLHIPTLAPTLSIFITFTSYAMISFIVTEREKNFLRKAFGTYLSGDVINEIIADPHMLSLGGQKRWMSAMFTDVKGFSTISEQLEPEQLVNLLNKYLSGMSNIILENRGTIDKYEGDAIISFFGAPVINPDHAAAACRSALLMKQKEAEMNTQFITDALTPTPLLTRIGINTGDMVVGNMGTERKMDYTIMGNAVNLAARLEGVNKQYGSWILISDMVKREAGDTFIFRRFDRVRVVGIHTPVQLWELCSFANTINDKDLDFLDRFEKAKVFFDSQNWKKSEKLFEALAKERPDDGPAATYLKRSRNFIGKPPAKDWDGVFSLTEK